MRSRQPSQRFHSKPFKRFRKSKRFTNHDSCLTIHNHANHDIALRLSRDCYLRCCQREPFAIFSGRSFTSNQHAATEHTLRQRRARHLQLSRQASRENSFRVRFERSDQRSWLLAVSLWPAGKDRARVSERSKRYAAEVSLQALLSRAVRSDRDRFHDRRLRVFSFRRLQRRRETSHQLARRQRHPTRQTERSKLHVPRETES
jgi:hypothetical protein